jgi:hypothetical protein
MGAGLINVRSPRSHCIELARPAAASSTAVSANLDPRPWDPTGSVPGTEIAGRSVSDPVGRNEAFELPLPARALRSVGI